MYAWPESTFPVTAFYKGESQEKTLLLRLEGAGTFACSPAHVMLGGSGFFFLQIHRDRDDALGYRCQQAGWPFYSAFTFSISHPSLDRR
jgi:hypothetical protein